MNQPIFLRVSLSPENAKKGVIKGVAYTGAVIKQHGFLKNLVIDLSTLSVHKPEKTVLLRDHNPSLVAGHAKIDMSDKEVLFEGVISQRSAVGKEIIDLSEDGIEWEVSLGLFDGQLVEFENEEYNGQMIDSGNVIKNAVLREVSIVALGADMNTRSEILNQNNGNKGVQMKLSFTEEQWAKFACGCGGSKESTAEDLQEKFAEGEEKAAELEKEIAALKEQIAAKQAEIDALKGKEETAARSASIKAAASEKGIKLSDEKINLAAASKEKTDLLLGVIADMEAGAKKIDPKLAGRQNVSTGDKVESDPRQLANKAQALVKEGKYPTFLEAMASLEVK